jgi:putative aminopeptidase FrvX
MNALDILEVLCLKPTVSYHEHLVAREILGTLSSNRIAARRDRWGNVLAELPGDESLPPLVFVAHMDHPGFEAMEVIEVGEEDEVIYAEPRGGIGARAYDVGTGVRVVARNGVTLYGYIESHGPLRRIGRFARTDRVVIRPELNASVRKASQLPYPAAVVLDLPSFSVDGDLIRGRQLDDLAGCATILTALTTIESEGSNRRPIVGLFTRAEEVGLVGAALAAGDETISKDAIVVSIETSLKSDSAKQGEGVVIRVGDRMTTFDHEAESVLHLAANRVKERGAEGKFKVQRMLMSAGGCEASAFKAHGYRVTGTSFPLGAWHNTEDDGSIAPEYIHIDDFQSGIALITEAMRDDGRQRQNDVLRYLASFPEAGAMRLRETLV